jgi:hypothetical protein
MQPVYRVLSSSRNLVAICAAVVVGILVGGASVLAVAFTLIEPPPQDAPAGSAVFDGRPHVVQQTPAATPEEPQTAAASAPTDSAPLDKTTTATAPPAKLPAEPVTPADAKAEPAIQQQTPTQVLNKTWPHVPSARQPLKPESAAALATTTPKSNAPKPNAPAQTASVQGNGDNSPVQAGKEPSQTKTMRTVTSHNYSPRNTQTAVPNGDAQQRVVVIPGNAPQQRDDDNEVASTGTPRPLFDFFSHGPFDDEGQRDDNRDVTSVPSPQLRTGRNPRDPQLVIRHRRDRDDDAVKSGPPQYYSGNNFFGVGGDNN